MILIDGTGTGFGDHLLVIALGIDTTGQKHVLGVVEGTTESEEVCKSLLRDLSDPGLEVERARLFVLDGGKGVRKAVRTTFGEWGLVQRCQIHELRSILEHLPEHRRAWVRAAIRKAWAEETVVPAENSIRAPIAGRQRSCPRGRSVPGGRESTVRAVSFETWGNALRRGWAGAQTSGKAGAPCVAR